MLIKNYPQKILVVLGPTSSGKTKLAVRLAALFNGEIISADSRQVYKGMDVGTGKDLQDYSLEFPISNIQLPIKSQISNHKSQTIKIPYHLIDVADPKKQFDLARYQKLAYKAIDDILKRGRLPIVVGGSGLYLQAVVEGYKLDKVKADKALRRQLEKLSAAELFSKLKKLNPAFAEKLNQSDSKNKRRLVRYVEIGINNVIARSVATKQSQVNFQVREIASLPPVARNDIKYQFLLIGLNPSKEVLRQHIYQRLIDRLEKQDMIGEVKKLHEQGLSWQRLESFGLEYKFIALYLQDKLGYDEMAEKLNTAICQFSRKQMTWFRRWQRQGRVIKWVDGADEAVEIVKKFLR